MPPPPHGDDSRPTSAMDAIRRALSARRQPDLTRALAPLFGPESSQTSLLAAELADALLQLDDGADTDAVARVQARAAPRLSRSLRNWHLDSTAERAAVCHSLMQLLAFTALCVHVELNQEDGRKWVLAYRVAQKVMQALQDGHGPTCPEQASRYVYKAAHNAWRDAQRRERRARQNHVSIEDIHPNNKLLRQEEPIDTSDLRERLSQFLAQYGGNTSEMRAALQDVLRGMPPAPSGYLTRLFVDGMTDEEQIAEDGGGSEGTDVWLLARDRLYHRRSRALTWIRDNVDLIIQRCEMRRLRR